MVRVADRSVVLVDLSAVVVRADLSTVVRVEELLSVLTPLSLVDREVPEVPLIVDPDLSEDPLLDVLVDVRSSTLREDVPARVLDAVEREELLVPVKILPLSSLLMILREDVDLLLLLRLVTRES